MKFAVTSFNTFEVIPGTRFRDGRTDGRTDVQTDRVTPVYPKLRLWGYDKQEGHDGPGVAHLSIMHCVV